MSLKAKKLGSLADIFQAETLDGTITKIDVDTLVPSAIQPRWDRTQGVNELAKSISHDGLLSPIVVCKEGGQYRIIAGERRYHAVKKLQFEQVDCRIISRSEKDYWRIALIENLQRENLMPWEEAAALAQLKRNDELSDAEVGKLTGKSRNYISEILSLSQLPEKVIEKSRQMGITQVNMMIQVAHAYKNGTLDEFFHAYQTGAIDTVQKAKNFRHKNKRKNYSNNHKKRSSASHLKSTCNLLHQTDKHEIWVSEDTNQVHVLCTNTVEKNRIVALLKQETNKANNLSP